MNATRADAALPPLTKEEVRDRDPRYMPERMQGKFKSMLFLFDDTDVRSFWMRNTVVSLDMIFLADDRAVVGVVPNAEPRTDSPRSVGKPSRYVLEVAAGEAFAHAVGPGARAVFVGVPE